MIIEVEKLKKVYKKNFRTVCALNGIGFQLEKNRILGILGPNGAGKTTLLKIITGITTPDNDSGGVTLFGSRNIGDAKKRIGFLPENPEFFRNISAQELLEFSLKVSGAEFDSGRIDEMLKRVSLFHERKERVKNFSKGMRQRIGIAQAIIHSPELLILDEPMSGLDPPGRRMVIELIEHYYKEGKTIIFSTHNLDDIEALCTDVMVLNKGEILLEKSLRQLRINSSYKIELETETGKQTVTAKNSDSLWQTLEQAKSGGQRIVKVQSGIARQLEKYFNDTESEAYDARV